MGARLLALLVPLVVLITSPAIAQENNKFYEPTFSAMPVAERPAELRDARDLINHENQALRLRADVWARVAPCPKRKPRENCLISTATEGRIFIGPIWFDDALAGFEIEKLWLLRKGETWSTTQLRKLADNKIEFSNGPPWAANQPVDVVIKLKGISELLQIRYRNLYPMAS